MAIYLDDQTGPELKRLLKKEIERSPKNFIAPRLLKMVEADDQRKKEQTQCTHTFQPLYGFHEQCTICHTLKDGYEIWEAEKPPAVS